jgi:hypothetical protein
LAALILRLCILFFLGQTVARRKSIFDSRLLPTARGARLFERLEDRRMLALTISAAFDASITQSTDPGVSMNVGVIESDINATLKLYDNYFSNDASFTITFGFSGSAGAISASHPSMISEDYTEYLNILKNDEVPNNPYISLAEKQLNPGDINPVTNSQFVDMTDANITALGFNEGTAGGTIVLNFDQLDVPGWMPSHSGAFIASHETLQQAVENEVDDIMGFGSSFNTFGSFADVEDMYRYVAPGQLATSGTQQAYLSLDGGNTALAHFNTVPDQQTGALYSDWTNTNFGFTGVGDQVQDAGGDKDESPMMGPELLLLEMMGWNPTGNTIPTPTTANPTQTTLIPLPTMSLSGALNINGDNQDDIRVDYDNSAIWQLFQDPEQLDMDSDGPDVVILPTPNFPSQVYPAPMMTQINANMGGTGAFTSNGTNPVTGNNSILTLDMTAGTLVPVLGVNFNGGDNSNNTLNMFAAADTFAFNTEVQTPTTTTAGTIQFQNQSVATGPVSYSNTGFLVDNVGVTGTATYNPISTSNQFVISRGPAADRWATTEMDSANGAFGSILFANKLDAIIVGGSGNDTMTINYGAINPFGISNPLIFANMTFNAGGGVNTVNAIGDGNYTLTNSMLLNSGTAGTVFLNGVTVVNITTDTDNDTFNINAWTGTGSITGGSGTNTLNVTKDAYFTLSNAALSTSDGMSMRLSHLSAITLSGAGTDINQFDVSGYTGKATITGNGANDALIASKIANFDLIGNNIYSSDGMGIQVIAMPRILLFGGAGGHTINVESWNATGAITMYGGTGADSYVIGNGDLDNILASLVIRDTGGTNLLTLIDENDTKLVNYQLTASTFTTNSLSGPARSFQGLAVTYGALSAVTLDSNVHTNEIDVTPTVGTTFTINSFSFFTTAATADLLNVNFAGAQSTTFLPSNSGGNGVFMFSNYGNVSFTGIKNPNSPVPAAAVNAIGTDAGTASQPDVIIIDSATGQTLRTLTNVYAAGYQGGVRVAIGDVTGDGIPDIIVAPGRGHSPLVEVFSLLTGQLLYSFMGDAATDTNGLLVAVGDVNGDGKNDIITAPSTGVANVHVFAGTGSSTPITGYSTSTPTIKAFSSVSGYQGGVGGLAVGVLPGSTIPEIVVGSGIGINASAQVFNFATHGTSSTPVQMITPLFSSSVRGGVSVAVGDVNNDGVNDVIFGAGAGAASQIDFWSGAGSHFQNQFTAFTGTGNNAAVHIAVANVNGTFDIIAGQGTAGTSHEIKYFTFAGTAAGVDAVMENDSFFLDGFYLG